MGPENDKGSHKNRIDQFGFELSLLLVVISVAVLIILLITCLFAFLDRVYKV